MVDDYAFSESLEECELPKIKKIEDETLIFDCNVPLPPNPVTQCPDPIIPPPPGIPGLDGVCPYFDIDVTVQVVPADQQPSVSVELCETPPNYPDEGSVDPANPLSLDQCRYRLCFTFFMPEPPGCPAVEIEARATFSPSGEDPWIEVQKTFDEATCSYTYDFGVHLPCPSIEITAHAGYKQIPTGEGIQLEVTQATEGCSHLFDMDFSVPCPSIELTAQVVRGPAAVCVVPQYGQNVYQSEEQIGQSASRIASCFSQMCGDLLDPEPLVDEPNGCAYGYSLYIDSPCPDILATARVVRGPGAISISKRSNVIDGDPQGTILTQEEITAEMEKGFRTTPSGLSCSGSNSGVARNNCESAFDFELDLPCAEISFTPNVKVVPTRDYREDFEVSVSAQFQEPVPQSGDPCDHAFNLNFKVPKFCPEITGGSASSNGGSVSISVFPDEERCAYGIVPSLVLPPKPCTPITLEATLSTKMDCQNPCGQARLNTNPSECGGYTDFLGPIIQAILGSRIQVCIVPLQFRFYFQGDIIKVTFNCCTYRWEVVDGGHEEIDGEITEAGDEGISGPEEDEVVTEIRSPNGGTTITVTTKKKDKAKFYKEGRSVRVRLDENCEPYIAAGGGSYMISGPWEADNGESDENGKIHGVRCHSDLGEIPDGRIAKAMVDTDTEEVQVIAADCEGDEDD